MADKDKLVELPQPAVDPSANPHPADEDPEEHMGAEILDPWSDPTQLDWPTANDEGDDEVAE